MKFTKRNRWMSHTDALYHFDKIPPEEKAKSKERNILGIQTSRAAKKGEKKAESREKARLGKQASRAVKSEEEKA